MYLYLQLYLRLYLPLWKWKVWCYVVQTGVVHTSAHQLRPQPVSVASVEGRMASGLCATNLGPPGVWRQTLITVPPNLGIQSQLTPFLLWPGGSNWRNVRAGTTNKRRESKQEGGVEHQSHISLSETADHPLSSCEQKEKKIQIQEAEKAPIACDKVTLSTSEVFWDVKNTDKKLILNSETEMWNTDKVGVIIFSTCCGLFLVGVCFVRIYHTLISSRATPMISSICIHLCKSDISSTTKPDIWYPLFDVRVSSHHRPTYSLSQIIYQNSLPDSQQLQSLHIFTERFSTAICRQSICLVPK